MSEQLIEQPLPTDGRYTTQEAADRMGLSVRQFSRVCEKEGLKPVDDYRDGQRHGVLYSANAVDFLVGERNARRVDVTARRTKTPTDNSGSRADTDIIPGIPNAVSAVALREVIVRVYEDNMALRAERDEARARLRELEGQAPVELPVRRKRFWIF